MTMEYTRLLTIESSGGTARQILPEPMRTKKDDLSGEYGLYFDAWICSSQDSGESQRGDALLSQCLNELKNYFQ